MARVESQLPEHLRDHPEVPGKLMESPLHKLGPADPFYCALALEEVGPFPRGGGHPGPHTPRPAYRTIPRMP